MCGRECGNVCACIKSESFVLGFANAERVVADAGQPAVPRRPLPLICAAFVIHFIMSIETADILASGFK